MDRVTYFYKKHPLLILFILFVLLPLGWLTNNIYQTLQSSLPITEGQQSVSGLKSEVRISRDKSGVVSIESKHDVDAFFAMGYVHAQDRLWQLTIQKRMSQGRLAEVFGASALQMDIYIRTLGIQKAAKSSWHSLDERAKQSLIAYSNGINQWLAEDNALPLEFRLLGIEPELWKPEDSIAWLKTFSLSLSGDYQKDLQRLLVMQGMPKSKSALLNSINVDETVTLRLDMLNEVSQLIQLTSSLEKSWGLKGKNIGSNAWVVGPEFTENGYASLWSDPHLGLNIPSNFYAVKLNAENLHASGMSMVGLPIVMIGKNKNIAWGITNMMADTMDLYYERVDTQNINQYWRNGEWVNFDIEHEEIKVKAAFPSVLRSPFKPYKLQIRNTEHGPIISDLLGMLEQPLSLRWLGNHSNDTTYMGFLELNYSTNWDAFRLAANKIITPAINLLYIDSRQNIGYLAAGKIPIRGAGSGEMPVAAWDSKNAWQGFIPQEQMPQSFNPVQGYLLSANNQIIDSSYPYYISADWAEPERAERIKQLIEQNIANGGKLSTSEQNEIQLDVKDLAAMKLLPHLLSIESDNKQIVQALQKLKAWDGYASKDAVAPTIYYSWVRHLRLELFADDFAEAWSISELKNSRSVIVNDIPTRIIIAALTSEENDWCDRLDTEELENCDKIKIDSLKAAIHELTKLLGDDMDEWLWGNAHHALYQHRPFSSITGLDWIFERREANAGSENTIRMAASQFNLDDGYVQSVGPEFRQNIQFLPQKDFHILINSTGQSGNVVSQNYGDIVSKFIAGQYHPIYDSTSEIKQLVLVPERDGF